MELKISKIPIKQQIVMGVSVGLIYGLMKVILDYEFTFESVRKGIILGGAFGLIMGILFRPMINFSNKNKTKKIMKELKYSEIDKSSINFQDIISLKEGRKYTEGLLVCTNESLLFVSLKSKNDFELDLQEIKSLTPKKVFFNLYDTGLEIKSNNQSLFFKLNSREQLINILKKEK